MKLTELMQRVQGASIAGKIRQEAEIILEKERKFAEIIVEEVDPWRV